MTITATQAQETLNNIHRVLAGWKEQKKTFQEASMRDRDNVAARHLVTLLDACIDELEVSLKDYRSPDQWKSALLADLKLTLEKHGG